MNCDIQPLPNDLEREPHREKVLLSPILFFSSAIT